MGSGVIWVKSFRFGLKGKWVVKGIRLGLVRVLDELGLRVWALVMSRVYLGWV